MVVLLVLVELVLVVVVVVSVTGRISAVTHAHIRRALQI